MSGVGHAKPSRNPKNPKNLEIELRCRRVSYILTRSGFVGLLHVGLLHANVEPASKGDYTAPKGSLPKASHSEATKDRKGERQQPRQKRIPNISPPGRVSTMLYLSNHRWGFNKFNKNNQSLTSHAGPIGIVSHLTFFVQSHMLSRNLEHIVGGRGSVTERGRESENNNTN